MQLCRPKLVDAPINKIIRNRMVFFIIVYLSESLKRLIYSLDLYLDFLPFRFLCLRDSYFKYAVLHF